MGTEQGAEFYTGKKYMRPDIYARYEPIYRQAANLLPPPDACPRIVDLGCGVGHFAKMLADREYAGYLGIDFSPQMLAKAKKQTPLFRFVQGDLVDENTHDLYANDSLFVLLELLEHIKDDLATLESIPVGSRAIFSVPSFDARSHVRRFKNTGAVIARYGHLLRFDKIVQMPWGKSNKVFMFNCERT